MLQVKGMLNKARIFISEDSSVEVSHHYGIERFREFGCIIIDCINWAYCKKLVVQLPRQKPPIIITEKKKKLSSCYMAIWEWNLKAKEQNFSQVISS